MEYWGSKVYLARLRYIFSSRIRAGVKWKNRSNISSGRVKVPFFSMINFSSTCGMGLIGARIINIAATMRIEYGILSRNVHIHRIPKLSRHNRGQAKHQDFAG